MSRRVRAKRRPKDRRELLRAAALEAAARLFAEKGFRGTNLQDIAAELGVSRPALYYYFKSKDDILNSLVEEVTVFSGQQAITLAMNSNASPGEILQQMAFSHAKWLLDRPTEFRVVDRTEGDLPPSVRLKHEQAKRVLLDNFTRVIERGIENGSFRSIEPRIAAFSIIAMCSWTAWWFKPTGRLSTEQVAQAIADFALHGVRRSESKNSRKLDLQDALNLLRDDVNQFERLLQLTK